MAVVKKLNSVVHSKYTKEQFSNLSEEEISNLCELYAESMIELYSKKTVWFMIHEEHHGEYSISIYYDNEYNHAAGEDL